MLVHWGLTYAFLTFLLVYRLWNEIPKIYVITIGYLLCLSNTLLCFRQLGMVGFDAQAHFLLATAGFQTVTFLLFCEAATFKFNARNLLKYFLMSLSIVAIILQVFGIKVLPHPGSNGVMIALGFPYFLQNKKLWPLIVLGIYGLVIKLDSSIALGAASVALISTLYLNNKKLYAALGTIPLIVGAIVFGPTRLLDDTSRFEAYKIFLGQWWRDGLEINLFGYGPGSFEILSQRIQYAHEFMLKLNPDGSILGGVLWLHMHSDILQALFEYGIIGFILVLSCAFTLFRSLKEFPIERAVFLTCLAPMCIDFPVRYPIVPIALFFLFNISHASKRV